MTRPPRPVRPDAALRELQNVGPATAADLFRLGIRDPAQLRGRDPYRMYDALCKKDGVRHDPCLIDVFISIVEFAGGAKARPWWHYTPLRKKHLQKKGRTV